MTNLLDSLVIDASRHLSGVDLVTAFAQLAAPPTPRGSLDHLVVRDDDGSHRVIDSIEFSPERGIHEDRWTTAPDRQVAMMETAVATLFANRQPLALFGNNLFVDLDLSEASTPVGTRIRVGSAVLEVASELHTACSTFRDRFGVDAARFSGQEPERHLRGLFLDVVEAGTASAGDSVAVVSRG
jgi:MOSC domain-containing protein YiiM